ncbi:FtsW/RodA/SpoVE family cell cycle protein [Calidithermus roseus]|uniref:Putative peptidoglycan glycosyltransferase FtsW n=1 Tax=Calidithermus roseus TaxID=1644118 RepID=A0A399EH04_9DEIN|nr:FtsW/RodA/SpoVE family cell cycle protein [Calidithermus roseus]RIH82833.1 putative peptidoglycan glycosyltransferase FtsW [Calidithermus roseus]
MDPVLLLSQALLLGFSFIGIATARPNLLEEHLIRVALCITATGLGALMRPMWLVRYAKPLFALTLALLVGVLFVGTGPTGEYRRWFSLGPVDLQPSELLKLVAIFYIAAYFHQRNLDQPILKVVAWLGLASVLVVAEPDVDGGILMVVLTGTMLLLIGVPWRRILALTALLGVLLLAFMTFIPSKFAYIPQRFEGMRLYLRGEADPGKEGYQATYAHRAILQAGPFGRGPGAPMQIPTGLTGLTSDLAAVPIVWATGWVGGAMLLSALGLLLLRGFNIALHLEGSTAVLATGLTSYLLFQTTFNLMGTLIYPIIGMPLPFVSYGGTSLITAGFAVGLIHALAREARPSLSREATS